MPVYQEFIEHLRTSCISEVPKPVLLNVYRNIKSVGDRIHHEEDWYFLEQCLRNSRNGKLPDIEEVNIGLEYMEAFHEADACLECYTKPCSTGKIGFADEETLGGCPVMIDIPGFIKLVKEGKIFEAWKKLVERDSLPAVTGRVCPQEDQCQLTCSVAIKDEPVEIGRLERFVADYVWEKHPEAVMDYIESLRHRKSDSTNSQHHIAVVGSGPAGLTVAIDLAIQGFRVTIFEALHTPGGVLAYGIPVFRLPSKVLERELNIARYLGVNFVFNVTIGRSITANELFDYGFSAVFIGTGAGLPRMLNIPGENLKQVYSANEFLVRLNLLHAYKPDASTPVKIGDDVVVVGGGFTAIDAARWAKRMGAKNVHLVYRRSREEMPAREEEVENAEEEGVELKLLTNPLEFIGDDNHTVRAVKCVRMRLGEPDSSGRRRPVPIRGSEHEIVADTVITALGSSPNPTILETTENLETTKWGTIQVKDQNTGETSVPLTYAGGDVVTGAATVILAMGAGKQAAHAINLALKNKEPDPKLFQKSLDLVEECRKPFIIKKNEQVAADIYEIVVQAPIIAKHAKAGQFLLVMNERYSERIPLTIADWDAETGEIVVVSQVVGKGTADLEELEVGDEFFAISGPLGIPSEIEKVDGKVLMVAGGVGLAALYPIMREHCRIGNDVHLIYGARNRELFFWMDRIKELVPEEKIHLATNDGSLGTQGFVTDVIKEKFMGVGDVSFAVVIGPAVMMRATAQLTQVAGIPTIVSLNSPMLDGSAMCGGCKIARQDGKLGTKDFACYHGPDRLAEEVDLDELVARLSMFQNEESYSLSHHVIEGLLDYVESLED